MQKKRASLKIRLYMAFWLFIIVSFVVGISLQFSKYNNYSLKEKELEAMIASEEKRAKELNKDEQYYYSDEFVEKVAREQLGYIRSDEYIFYNESK